ncbi:MAG: hypothetical protein R3266_07970, partial [Gemmatimonadota bacterium]|nr:hypothetical protein [Gemmatimonadota bacterium]
DEPVAEPGTEITLGPGELRVWRYRVTAPAGAGPTHPYFLERPREGSVYRWPDDPGVRARPFRPPVLTGTADVAVRSHGAALAAAVTVPVRYRGVTGSRGEFWRPIHVAPSVSVSPVTETLIWSTSDLEPREIDLRVTSHDPRGARGAVELELPDGWVASPARRGFVLDGEGSETTVSFSLAPEADTRTGESFVRPRLETPAGPAPAVDARFIDYEHIEARLLAPPASVRIIRFPVRVAERSVGYVMGSGDQGPQAIRQLGLRVEPIEPGDWRTERLERFDTIVLGVRAYEVRDDLVASNELLLDWVERGGTLVVQYNRYEFNDGDFAPYPITIGRPAPRVTDETAPITFRRPDALPLREPNRITAADFEGWVQERGLYFPTSWDDRYEALLALSDPGEPDRLGSLLVAPYGEGAYVHTSLSFFRQLRAGVPGAFRLFANLISLDGRRLRAAS